MAVPIKKCLVHPVVLFSIIDAFERRTEDPGRVIGTLVGTKEAGVVEVTECFCVPHSETEEEVAVDVEFAKNMYELHKKGSSSESIVGWYATGCEVTEHSVLIHDYYSKEVKNPIHLTVDTHFKGVKMGINCYVSAKIGPPGDYTEGTIFIPVQTEITQLGQERLAVNLFNENRMNANTPMLSELQQVRLAIAKIQEMLDLVIGYVDLVTNGTVVPDQSIGRTLMDLVAGVPQVSKEKLTSMVNSNFKDLLMVDYLCGLVRTQLTIQEKLSNLLLSS